MRQTELVTLNMRELDRLKMVQAIVEMGLKPGRPRTASGCLEDAGSGERRLHLTMTGSQFSRWSGLSRTLTCPGAQ